MGRLYDATWGRAFTAIYNRGLRASEGVGLLQMRRRHLSEATGRTLEVGAGTGANPDLYPVAVREFVLVESDPHMVGKLSSRLKDAAALGPSWSRRRQKPCPSRVRVLTPRPLPWRCAQFQIPPRRSLRPPGCCAQAAECCSSSASVPSRLARLPGRIASSASGASWATAATAIAIPSPPSRPRRFNSSRSRQIDCPRQSPWSGR
jgi:hypothetical protein